MPEFTDPARSGQAEPEHAEDGLTRRARTRRRNRHGRGSRGRMLPPELARRRHPMVEFSDMVGRAMGALPEEIIERLDAVDVLSLNTPLADEHMPPADALAPLMGFSDPGKQRVYLYRWPIMMVARRERRPLKDVVADRLAFELAGLWGLRPEQVDPHFGQPR